MSKYIIINNKILSEDQVPNDYFNADQTVYEVIRLIEGVALFVEDHYSRLLESVHLSGIKFSMEMPDFIQHIQELMNVNQQFHGNVKFMLTKSERNIHWVFSFIPHHYPDENDYKQGVRTGLLFSERNNPKAKVIQHSVREKADMLMKDKKFYEVLLVDSNGKITEGSRSNVFFVKDNQFYTAPASQVLSGVTRKKVLECMKDLNYLVIEEAVPSKDLISFEAAFLTGTSPKILPINTIDDLSFKINHSLVNKLMNHYNKKIDEYIKLRKA